MQDKNSKTQEKTPWNPSRRAILKVLNPLPAPTECHYCQSSVEIKSNAEVYGKAFGDWPWIFLCSKTNCLAYVGMHPYTNIPLGTLADAKTREARKKTKELFNLLWQTKSIGMTRTQAYEWLALQLNIPVARCHFGWFDVETCIIAYKEIRYFLSTFPK